MQDVFFLHPSCVLCCASLAARHSRLQLTQQEQVRVDAEEREELTVAASAMTGEGLDDFVTCLEVINKGKA